MRKIIAVLLAALMVFALVACGKEDTTPVTSDSQPATVGTTLSADFMEKITANPEMTAQEMADALLTNPIIQFAGASMPVEQGLLMGAPLFYKPPCRKKSPQPRINH